MCRYVIGLELCVASFTVGMHIRQLAMGFRDLPELPAARELNGQPEDTRTFTDSMVGRRPRLSHSPSTVILLSTSGAIIIGAVSCLIYLAVVRGSSIWVKWLSLSLLFAPFGVFARNGFDAALNPSANPNGSCRPRFFYVGTLAANVLACALVAVIGVWQETHGDINFRILMLSGEGSKKDVSGNVFAVVVAGALETGFCGCLSTASSLAGEIWKLLLVPTWHHQTLGGQSFGNNYKPKKSELGQTRFPKEAYKYAASTVSLSLGVGLGLLGGLRNAKPSW